MNNVYEKLVSPREAEIYRIAAKHDIAPSLIGEEIHLDSPKITIITQLYPEVLIDVMKDKERHDEVIYILEEARKLVRQLHQLGFLHSDLSEENIVYNKVTRDVRLIDFGMSIAISEIDLKSISHYVDNLYEGVRYGGENTNDIDYICRIELGILTFLEKASGAIQN